MLMPDLSRTSYGALQRQESLGGLPVRCTNASGCSGTRRSGAGKPQARCHIIDEGAVSEGELARRGTLTALLFRSERLLTGSRP